MEQSPNLKNNFTFNNKEEFTNFYNLILNDLYDKYKDETILMDKLANFINNLHKQLISYKNDLNLRNERKNILSQEEIKFYNKFLSENNYFYNVYNNDYFVYDNKFKLINEDEIYVKILSLINNDETSLNPWKFKIKTSTLKQIKNRSIFDAIPDSNTIQSIYSLIIPLLFNTKNEAKLLLTLVGDNILKKETNINFFVDKSVKPFIDFINSKINFYFKNVNTITNIKYKFQDHNLENSRLLCIKSIKHMNFNEILFNNIFDDSILDFLIVSIHYSNRYKNSLNYINEECNNVKLIDYCNFLNNSSDSLFLTNFIKQFINDNKIICTYKNDCNISFQNLKYLWNLYLYEKNIISFLSNEQLKEKIKAYFGNVIKSKSNELYSEFLESIDSKNIYLSITSSKVPSISNFLDYWNDNYYINEDDENSETNKQYFEIEEIINQYKLYCKKKKITWNIDIGTIMYFLMGSKTFLKKKNIEYINLKKIIKKNSPSIKINIDNNYKKHYINIISKEWDKIKEIKDFLIYHFETINEEILKLNNSYELYSKYKNDISIIKILMSKDCFLLLLLNNYNFNNNYDMDNNTIYKIE